MRGWHVRSVQRAAGRAPLGAWQPPYPLLRSGSLPPSGGRSRSSGRRSLHCMPGTLVLCATPIGNLGDTSPRLLEVLARADVIYAEDTRRAARLFRHLAIDRSARSYFVGNEAERAVQLRDELANGMTVALLTDAGTPSVSDPGFERGEGGPRSRCDGHHRRRAQRSDRSVGRFRSTRRPVRLRGVSPPIGSGAYRGAGGTGRRAAHLGHIFQPTPDRLRPG